MRKWCPNRWNLFIFSARFKAQILGHSALYLISELLNNLLHHILPVIQRYQCSNTESLRAFSFLSGHIFETYNRTNFIGCMQSRRLFDKWTFCNATNAPVWWMLTEVSVYGKTVHRVHNHYRIAKCVSCNDWFHCNTNFQLWVNPLIQRHFTFQRRKTKLIRDTACEDETLRTGEFRSSFAYSHTWVIYIYM